MRFGLIGVGRWGKVYIKTLCSLPDRCRLTHLATSKPSNAALVPYPVTVLSDWRALLQSDCDAVIIAAPPSTHAEILEACLDVEKPCIVEKPFCLDVGTAQRLQHRIQVSGVPVLVDHTHLFDPAYLVLKRSLDAAGEPIRFLFAEGGGWGPFRTDISALWDWGPHEVSLCLDLLADTPQHVSAMGTSVRAEGLPDAVCIRLDFTRGATAWLHTGRVFSSKRRNLTIITERNRYHWDGVAPSQQLSVSPIEWTQASDVKRLVVPEGPTPLANMIAYFINGLAGGDRQRFGTELGLEVTRVLATCETLLAQREMVK